MRNRIQVVRLTAATLLLFGVAISCVVAQRSIAATQSEWGKKLASSAQTTRWSPAQNRTWRWFEREALVDGKWRLTGLTTPIHRETGERYTGAKGYLADSDVPADIRKRGHAEVELATHLENDPAESNEPGKVDPIRQAREGRPASKWLRGLGTAELREWLPTIDPPEAGVEGMTFYEHLTRDHGFIGENIKDLSEEEQAKLHAAAHAGY
jgi:hypothetical protein